MTDVPDHPLKGQIVDSGFLWEDLHAAFSSVQNKGNWKMPVDCIIPFSGDIADDVKHLEKVKVAVQYFTGSICSVMQVPGGWRVQADGYYNAVGA